MDEPPNHWFKRVFFATCCLIGIVCLGIGIAVGSWAEALLGTLSIAAATGPLWLIRQGRNPSCMQGPLDRRAARRAGFAAPDTTPTMRQAAVVTAAVVIVDVVLIVLTDRTWAPLLGTIAVCAAWAARLRRRDASRTR